LNSSLDRRSVPLSEPLRRKRDDDSTRPNLLSICVSHLCGLNGAHLRAWAVSVLETAKRGVIETQVLGAPNQIHLPTPQPIDGDLRPRLWCRRLRRENARREPT